MTALTPLTIQLTSEQREKIEHLAEINGYESADEYALAILEQFIEEPTEEEILEDIRVSFREALTGETFPIKNVLAEIEADDGE